MGKALLGTHVPSESLRLLDEVRVLRQRVAELEAALDAATRADPADASTAEVPAADGLAAEGPRSDLDVHVPGDDVAATVPDREPATT